MRIIALYLPQYHRTIENDAWWGDGFTEWDSVKKGKPYLKNQYQPKIPLDDNYYDLSDENAETWAWQADLAHKYGVYGFCIYHYWFKNGKKILEKPSEILLKHSEIDIKYFFCWANEPWKRTWYSCKNELLIDQEYGDEEEWIDHYLYLSSFFMDDRYIKIGNKPVIAIYRTASIDDLEKMKKVWNALAIKDGYDGIFVLSGNTSFAVDERIELIDAFYRFEPAYTLHYMIPKQKRLPYLIRRKAIHFLNFISRRKRIENVEDMRMIYKYMPLSKMHNNIITYPGICPMWDNTARKQWKGTYFKNSSPKLFKEKLEELKLTLSEDDFVFVNAWNEWSEGAYLEPDKKNKYEYLEAISDVLEGK